MTPPELVEAIWNLINNTDNPDIKIVLYTLLGAFHSGHEMELATHTLTFARRLRDTLVQEQSRLN